MDCPMLEYCQMDHLEQTSVIFYRNSYIFINEKSFETVICEMAAICLDLNVLKCWWRKYALLNCSISVSYDGWYG